MQSSAIAMPQSSQGTLGFHRLQRTYSIDSNNLRAHSAPSGYTAASSVPSRCSAAAAAAVPSRSDSATLFGCSANSISEHSHDEETLDYSVSASNDDLSSSSSQEHKTSSAHFREFFGFLDDAHELGFAVRKPTAKQKCSTRAPSKEKRHLDLEQPSYERATRNAVVLQHRYSHYETLRRIEQLRRKHGVKVSLET